MEERILLSEKELENQLSSIVHFLSVVHPSLTGAASARPCIEIRPIVRGKKDYKLSRSLNIWDLSEKSISRLKSFLELHNGQPCCLYYSVYCFDNNTDTKTQHGVSGTKGKISINTALYTNEIVLDFDHIGEEEYISLSEKFESLGISPLWVFTGHGYQAHILLNEQIYDKNNLFFMVHLFRSKGFMCDVACVDAARVMRLPDTFNCKCFKDKDYAHELSAPPKCYIVNDSSKRYTGQFIIDKLNTLPTVSAVDEEFLSTLSPQQKLPALDHDDLDQFSKKNGLTYDQIMVLNKLEYPYINKFAIPAPISKMLAHTPKGYRNKVLGFLVRYFKKFLELSERQTYEILSIWAENACKPAYNADEDFDADFKRFYHFYNGLNYDADLTKKYGYIDFDNLWELRKQDIAIPNHFFEEFATLDGKAVRAYLAIKLLEHIKKPTTIEDLAKQLNISERALRPTLQTLVKTNHVYLVKGNRTKKIPHEYKSTKIVPSSTGSQIMSFNDVKAYISELYEEGSRGNGELKLFLYMRYKFFSGEIFMSQENLGNHIGLKQNSISVITKKLEDKYFISITKKYLSPTIFSCVYSLLR